MEQLRKLADLGRQHYEKIILVLALLGLGITVWVLNRARAEEAARNAEKLESIQGQLTNRLPALDMAAHLASLKLAEEPPDLDFSLPHNLVNPVVWQRQPNGELLKIETGGEVGPPVMEYTASEPLHFVISLERVTGSGYIMGVTREAAENPRLRVKRPSYATVGATNEFYALVEVKGEAKAPTELVLQLAESGEVVSVAPDQPYRRVDGYTATLNYPPENKNFPDRRVGDVLRFAGDEYKIVAIAPDEVVLLAHSNNKKHKVARKQP